LRTKPLPARLIFFAVVFIGYLLLSMLTSEVKAQYIVNMLLLAITISDKLQTMPKGTKWARMVLVRRLIPN